MRARGTRQLGHNNVHFDASLQLGNIREDSLHVQSIEQSLCQYSGSAATAQRVAQLLLPPSRLGDLLGQAAQRVAQLLRPAHQHAEAQTGQEARYPIEVLDMAAQLHAAGHHIQRGHGRRHLLSRSVERRLKQHIDLPRARRTGQRGDHLRQAIEVIGPLEPGIADLCTQHAVEPEHA
jgi:hypothetical protein